MLFVSEEESAALASHELAYEAAHRALVDVIDPKAVSFPVVLGHGSEPSNRFTIKSGAAQTIAGVKVGSYWPGNPDKGLPRHNSTIFLFDQSTGRLNAAVEASKLNAYRTAAADALAVNTLARVDARTIALFGAGHQAFYEVEAVCRVREIRDVLVAGRTVASVNQIVEVFKARGIPARASEGEAACAAADIIITATTASSPLFEANWVKAGTHISSMGSDRIGKQELPSDLFSRAKLFCDYPEQSRTIGEFQHATTQAEIVALGEVLAGKHPGRASEEDITVFDSSGLAIQDLYIAQAVLQLRHPD